jgi:hypothetical protein
MRMTRKMAGYIMLVVGILFIAMHVLALDGSTYQGLPTFLGIGFVFLILGILTVINCMMGDKECEVENP